MKEEGKQELRERLEDLLKSERGMLIIANVPHKFEDDIEKGKSVGLDVIQTILIEKLNGIECKYILKGIVESIAEKIKERSE